MATRSIILAWKILWKSLDREAWRATDHGVTKGWVTTYQLNNNKQLANTGVLVSDEQQSD